jgi:hypothetical protein
MLEFLTLQVFANILGIASIGAADWLYIRGRLRRRLYSLWVAFSSTAICLPVVTWTVSVFLGVGMASLALIGTLDAIMFFWIYYNLKRSLLCERFDLHYPHRDHQVRPSHRRRPSNLICRSAVLSWRDHKGGEIFQSAAIAPAGSPPIRDA